MLRARGVSATPEAVAGAMLEAQRDAMITGAIGGLAKGSSRGNKGKARRRRK